MTRALRHPGRIARLAFLPLAAVSWRCIVSHFRRQYRDPILPSRPLAAQRQDIRARYVETRAMLAVLLIYGNLVYGNLASALGRYRIGRLEPQKLGLGGVIEGDDVRQTCLIRS